MSNNKFLENDEIINKILKFMLDIIFLLSILRKLFQTSLNNQYCSKHFKKSITIFLKKLDKNTYNIFKIYKSIILFNIIDKIFESIMTNKLAWATKTHNLLFNLHIRKRRDISLKLTIYILIKRIHATWENKRVINVLLLNVSNAFDNVSHQRLLHNFRKRKIENSILSWI